MNQLNERHTKTAMTAIDIVASDAETARGAIAAAARRIAPYVRRTPVVEIDGADLGLPIPRLWLKLECLQRSGSFKARGAFTNLLSRETPPAGVVAASGGNHGAAVAEAAQALGVAATIFTPEISSPAKLAQIRAAGARLEIHGQRYADALAASEAWAAETGALPIHAYDSDETLIGQGTCAREFMAQAPDLDAVLIAVGGGGLIGGAAAWLRGETRLIAVEPHEAPTLAHALAAGEPVDAPAGGVAADSLAPRRIGSKPFALAQTFVERAVLVPDDAILDAQARLWRALRIYAEPGGAAALAALTSGAYAPATGEKIGVLICGANATPKPFEEADATSPAP